MSSKPLTESTGVPDSTQNRSSEWVRGRDPDFFYERLAAAVRKKTSSWYEGGAAFASNGTIEDMIHDWVVLVMENDGLEFAFRSQREHDEDYMAGAIAKYIKYRAVDKTCKEGQDLYMRWHYKNKTRQQIREEREQLQREGSNPSGVTARAKSMPSHPAMFGLRPDRPDEEDAPRCRKHLTPDNRTRGDVLAVEVPPGVSQAMFETEAARAELEMEDALQHVEKVLQEASTRSGERHCRVLRMLYEQETFRDIAENLGISAAQKAVARCRYLVRRGIKEGDIAWEDFGFDGVPLLASKTGQKG